MAISLFSSCLFLCKRSPCGSSRDRKEPLKIFRHIPTRSGPNLVSKSNIVLETNIFKSTSKEIQHSKTVGQRLPAALVASLTRRSGKSGKSGKSGASGKSGRPGHETRKRQLQIGEYRKGSRKHRRLKRGRTPRATIKAENARRPQTGKRLSRKRPAAA